ncbi:MAG: hypothetical protein HUJ53_04630 [Holdemanella sp.]|nr:hypothetical protein [Holdemanella sp.]
MSKGSSGLFLGTKGDIAVLEKKLENLFSSADNESTAVVWDHISATQDNYSGTVIPNLSRLMFPKQKQVLTENFGHMAMQPSTCTKQYHL